jgi:hypothetical protein
MIPGGTVESNLNVYKNTKQELTDQETLLQDYIVDFSLTQDRCFITVRSRGMAMESLRG